MQISNWVEILGAAFSIVYSLLLMREKTLGWWFGIAASLAGVVLFYYTKQEVLRQLINRKLNIY